MSSTSDTTPLVTIRMKVAEVKYAMPEMLEELKAERAAASFAMEQLNQQEIGKIFKTKSTRGKTKK